MRKMIKVLSLVGVSFFMLVAGPVMAASREYPIRPITLYAGFTPGGATANAANIFAEGARKYLPNPQPIVVEFKPGAATAVAADFVLKRPADGYSVFVATNDIWVKLAKDADKLSFNKGSFSHIGIYAFSPHMLLVSKESSWKKFEDFLDYAKKNPGKISCGLTGGIGSSGHLTTEIFMARLGIKMNLIPFSGGAPVYAALLGGHVDCTVTSPGGVGDHIMPGGGMQVVVVLGPKRWPGVPDVPTILEKGYNFEKGRGVWGGLAVHKDTPQPVLDTLLKVFNKTTDDPWVKESLFKSGFFPWNLGPAETEKIGHEEFDLAREFL